MKENTKNEIHPNQWFNGILNIHLFPFRWLLNYVNLESSKAASSCEPANGYNGCLWWRRPPKPSKKTQVCVGQEVAFAKGQPQVRNYHIVPKLWWKSTIVNKIILLDSWLNSPCNQIFTASQSLTKNTRRMIMTRLRVLSASVLISLMSFFLELRLTLPAR